jgi:hypothetical protein
VKIVIATIANATRWQANQRMRRTNRNSSAIKATSRQGEVFLEIVRLISAAREKAIRARKYRPD